MEEVFLAQVRFASPGPPLGRSPLSPHYFNGTARTRHLNWGAAATR
jgi:hypothetical protein